MKRIGLMIACALAALSPLIFSGCEASSSADTQLTLEPRNVTLGYLDSQLFTVSGGLDYRWSLQNESLGALNKRTGNQVVYTSYTTNATQLLTVESFILGASGNNPTNTSGSNAIVGVTATATISPLIQPEPSTPSTPSNTITSLTIDPPDATLDNSAEGRSQIFRVRENVSCSWRLKAPGYGHLSSTEGITVKYTATKWPTSTNNPSLIQNIYVTYYPATGKPLEATVPVEQLLP